MINDGIGDPETESISDPPENGPGGLSIESPTMEEISASDPPENGPGGMDI
jgi:hypothetical protein